MEPGRKSGGELVTCAHAWSTPGLPPGVPCERSLFVERVVDGAGETRFGREQARGRVACPDALLFHPGRTECASRSRLADTNHLHRLCGRAADQMNMVRAHTERVDVPVTERARLPDGLVNDLALFVGHHERCSGLYTPAERHEPARGCGTILPMQILFPRIPAALITRKPRRVGVPCQKEVHTRTLSRDERFRNPGRKPGGGV